MKVMKATCWLLLDNLKHGWRFDCNMTSQQAAEAMSWCVEQGYVAPNGAITDAGLVALLTDRVAVKKES